MPSVNINECIPIIWTVNFVSMFLGYRASDTRILVFLTLPGDSVLRLEDAAVC